MSGVTLADLAALFETPKQRPVLAPTRQPDALRFVALNLAGLQVRGTHNPEPAPVANILKEQFEPTHQEWRERILAKPGGFDGHRAVLLSFKTSGGGLQVHTGYRTFTEGRALRDVVAAARASGDLVLAQNDFLRPRPDLSWGASLATSVLLPRDHILCAQRALTLATDPGIWSASFTEILEPADIDRRCMAKLLQRMVSEELPALAGVGVSKFVGLGVRPCSYTWQLVAVLDLRQVPLDVLVPRLTALQPDAETSAWAVQPLHQISEEERPYPPALYRDDSQSCAHFETAEFLSRNVPYAEH